MKKSFLLLLHVAIVSFTTLAQNSKTDSITPKPLIINQSEKDTYVVSADTATTTIMLKPNYWRILGDKAGKLTIMQVASPGYRDQFHLYDSAALDYSVHTIWFKYHLKNNLQHNVSLCITGGADYNDLFYPDSSGNWKHEKSGWRVPYSKRDGLKRISYIPFSIDPGKEMVLYERRNYTWRVRDELETHLDFTDKLIEKRYIEDETFLDVNLIMSVLLGICWITCLINFMFYRVIKEVEYLHYALFMLMLGINYFSYTAGNSLLKDHPLLVNVLDNVSNAGIFFFLMQFIRSFFKTSRHFPRWDQVLKWINIIQFLPWLSKYFVWNQTQFTYNLITDFIFLIPFIFMDMVCITFFLIGKKKDRSVNTTIVAAIPIFILWGPVYSLWKLYYLSNYYFHTPLPEWFDQFYQINSLLILVGMLWLIIIFSSLLFKRYRNLQKDLSDEAFAKEKIAKEKEIEKSLLIAQKNAELEEKVNSRTSELKHTLETMKVTQAQLIQSEKMASLGELTAGIAHEIQNPLNFVNNFSEINAELIEELKNERSKENGEKDEKLQDELLTEIAGNEQKINHHGKRADAIVKGMLQHSRASAGKREPTDINALADEYLRLSYHGLRAKDKDFNADFKTDFDESIAKIEVVQQDIGRVLLNLYNNAFYAAYLPSKGGFNKEHKPSVLVTTKKDGDKVIVTVRDNGLGIPSKIVDKIFQPFFTTKPTGQGTGLGLSLSYDIIKAHGGEIRVETKDGEGAAFIIHLPT
jgi:two-component system NtrC family sensor kinase